MGDDKQDKAAEQPKYYFPNKMGRIALLAMEEVMGRNGINAVLNLANLRHLLANYPPSNFDRCFSFTEMSRIMGALDEMYGARSARGLALRTGRTCFRYGIRDFGPMLGMADLAFRVMPLDMKLRVGFEVFAEVFNKFSDHVVRVEEDEGFFIWTNERCGICWERTAPAPCCHLTVGIIQEALYWVSGGQSFVVEEIACSAVGSNACTIRIDKQLVD